MAQLNTKIKLYCEANGVSNVDFSKNVVRSTRRIAYGDIGEQLDEIYKDIDGWKARIKSIKDANPKS